MPKNVIIDIPSLAEGTLVEVPGLGVFPNGQTSQVNDERLDQYKQMGYEAPEGNFEISQHPVVSFEEKTALSEEQQKAEEALKASNENLTKVNPDAIVSVSAPEGSDVISTPQEGETK